MAWQSSLSPPQNAQTVAYWKFSVVDVHIIVNMVRFKYIYIYIFNIDQLVSWVFFQFKLGFLLENGFFLISCKASFPAYKYWIIQGFEYNKKISICDKFGDISFYSYIKIILQLVYTLLVPLLIWFWITAETIDSICNNFIN